MRGRHELLLGSLPTLSLLSLSFPASSSSFTLGNTRARSRSPLHLSSKDDDWNLGDEDDSRLDEMRQILESSWNGEAMGQVPSDSGKAAEACSQAVANAMRQNRNVLMVDLRLPSFDTTEGPRAYDSFGVYDFCSHLSRHLKQLSLVTKTLILFRNDLEVKHIEQEKLIRGDGDSDDLNDTANPGRQLQNDVDDFRDQLMANWDDESANPVPSVAPSGEPTPLASDNSSHRLGSMIGEAEISPGPDQFDQTIQAVDQHALLQGEEDALIIVAPYDTTDTVALRRTLARYGNTRTIIIVNSRIELLPRELDNAVMCYGILPLIARRGHNDPDAGLKAVVLKRYPDPWTVYVDVDDDGFYEAKGGPMSPVDSSDKQLPSPEWIALKVQAFLQKQ
mmetsp:Transcript_7663/g.17903  ORF Transcript_7663/g.17903 Transcript_7663/m.17903 type:complete len:392 (+) Transcript_7663:61-1236(+)